MKYECNEYDNLVKNKRLLADIVVVNSDKEKSTIIFDKTDYFEKMKLSDHLVEKSQTFIEEEQSVSNAVRDIFTTSRSIKNKENA